ncbi:TonB-dependent receptor [Massilia sp. G4R7]|uniref:TonB-dependent receptor n=1 Tax=Massilia phyllostachyos TaxID=2898585 RepID=A0ABS8Q1P7_9BURK|nr:TonB-dependent receptor [Massilia phyllostachyos]
MKHKSTFNKSAIAVALSMAFPAFVGAQEAAPVQPQQMQRVEVTGSSIKRTEAEAAAAVQILNRDDIEKTGETTALGILTTTASISTDISSATASSGSFATGSSGISMRGLSKVATLVLVNGRRIAPYGLSDGAQQQFTNLDAIAADAIERIEIFKDGASAIYGSDAIAGVVNIVLRKEFTGARVRASYRESQHFNDNRNKNLSAIVGWGDIDTNGFNTYLTAETYRRDGYSTGDLRNYYPAWHRLTPGRSTWDAKSSFSPTGNYYLSSTNIVAAPGCPAGDIDPTDKLCKFDTLNYSGLVTNNKRNALVSNTSFRIGNNIDAALEITYADATSDYIVAPFSVSNGSATTSSSIWYNVLGGKMVGPFSYPKLPVGHPKNPYTVPVEYRARMMDTGDGFNFNTTDTKQSRVMLTLTGNYAGWDWKSAGGWAKSEASKATRAVSAKGYTDAIVSGAYKFGQQNDPTLLNTMFPVRTTDGESVVKFFDATISKEVWQLPAGPVSIAFGTDIRNNSYMMKSSDNVLRGELVGIFGLQVDDDVNQYALFTEASVPLTKKLKMEAAARIDKTDNQDAHVSPKLGLIYNATDSLMLRATASGGFRAPNIVESGNGLGRSSVATGVQDPRRCPIANQLNALVQNAAGATTTDKAQANSFRNAECSAGLPSFVSSNPDLKPETSRSLTAGLIFEPIKNWSVGLDYFFIERRNEIGTRSVVDVLRGEASLPAGQLIRIDNSANDNQFLALVRKYAPGNTINYGGVGQLGMVYNPYVNSGQTRVQGFDFDAKGRFNAWGVPVRLTLDGSYLWKFQEYSVTDGSYGPNQTGTYDYGPRLNLVARAYVKQGNFDHAVAANFSSSYSTNSIASPTYCTTNNVAAQYLDTCARVGSNTTWNYSVAFTGIPHVRVTGYVDNIFAREAPIDWRGGWSQQFRRFGLAASYTY